MLIIGTLVPKNNSHVSPVVLFLAAVFLVLGVTNGPAWTEMTLVFKVDAQSRWVWEVESFFPVKTCFTHPVNVHITAMQNYIFLPAENQRGHF